MKYSLLIYSDPSRSAGMTEEEIQQARAEVMPQWIELFDYLGSHAESVEATPSDIEHPPSSYAAGACHSMVKALSRSERSR